LPRVDEWLLDGFNILHACFFGRDQREGWWAQPHRERLLDRIAHFEGEGTLWVVFDGSRLPESDDAFEEQQIRVVFAPSADDWIVRRVRQSPRPGAIGVVTADRKVADRSRHRGACVLHPAEFLRHCAPRDPGSPTDPDSDPDPDPDPRHGAV
jgi:predicted RNA-binding protein with PIN domain